MGDVPYDLLSFKGTLSLWAFSYRMPDFFLTKHSKPVHNNLKKRSNSRCRELWMGEMINRANDEKVKLLSLVK